MQKDGSNKILTLREVADRLRCSKGHVSKLLNGKVEGVPPLTHMSMGRRKVVPEECLELWIKQSANISVPCQG